MDIRGPCRDAGSVRRSRPSPDAVLAHAEAQLLATVDELVAALVTATAAHVRAELQAALLTIPGSRALGRGPRAAGRPSSKGRPGNAAPLRALEPDPVRLRAVIDEVIEERRLSERESQVLVASLHGTPRDRLADVLGVGENTVKTHVRLLLGKLAMGPTLNDAVWAVRCRVDGR